MQFKEWFVLQEGCLGYVIAALFEANTLFDLKPERKKHLETPPDEEVSGYKKDIKRIQAFALENPDNFAHVMMFAPLSAHANFIRHWENFPVLMAILQHHFKDKKVDRGELKEIIDKFDTPGHSLGATISGWKFDTIVQIWNNRKEFFQKIQALAQKGSDAELIAELCKITGVAPVKAGFIVQLLFGRSGCIDTHNIDIYSSMFPELKDELSKVNSLKGEKGAQQYVALLEKLKRRGVGTEELWNVWTDFIENLYKTISIDKHGPFASHGASLDPTKDPYPKFHDVSVKKTVGVGGNAQGSTIDIDAVTGRLGGAASQTHVPVHFSDLAGDTDDPNNPASAIRTRTNVGEKTPNKYFKGKDGKIIQDPDEIRDVIRRMSLGQNRKQRISADQARQMGWSFSPAANKGIIKPDPHDVRI